MGTPQEEPKFKESETQIDPLTKGETDSLLQYFADIKAKEAPIVQPEAKPTTQNQEPEVAPLKD